jgi:hypothetical protein
MESANDARVLLFSKTKKPEALSPTKDTLDRNCISNACTINHLCENKLHAMNLSCQTRMEWDGREKAKAAVNSSLSLWQRNPFRTHARKLYPSLVKVAARHYAVAAIKQSCSVLASTAALWTKKVPERTNAISEQNRTVRYDQNLGYSLSILGGFSCTVSYPSKWLSPTWLKFSDQTSHIL